MGFDSYAARRVASKDVCNYRQPESQDAAGVMVTECNEESDLEISVGLHQAALSLVFSIGTIGSYFDPEINDPRNETMKPYVFAQELCTENVTSRFATAPESIIGQGRGV